jgi:hypothetical protein
MTPRTRKITIATAVLVIGATAVMLLLGIAVNDRPRIAIWFGGYENAGRTAVLQMTNRERFAIAYRGDRLYFTQPGVTHVEGLRGGSLLLAHQGCRFQIGCDTNTSAIRIRYWPWHGQIRARLNSFLRWIGIAMEERGFEEVVPLPSNSG